MYTKELDQDKEFQIIEDMKEVLLKEFKKQADALNSCHTTPTVEGRVALGTIATGYGKLVEAQLVLQKT